MERLARLWKAKRVFTNNQGDWKLSKSVITTQILTIKGDIDIQKILDTTTPKGFDEVRGFEHKFKKPVLRWIPGHKWIGTTDGVKSFILKKGKQTVNVTSKQIQVLGAGNYEVILRALYSNGWITKAFARTAPTYNKIDGMFYINVPFRTEIPKGSFISSAAAELKKIPGSDVRQNPAIKNQLGTIVLRLNTPPFTYQFFKNGTVLFTGVAIPAQIDAPRQLFKDFFGPIIGLDVMNVLKLSVSPLIKRPNLATRKKFKNANRFKLAKSWNATPPEGYYIRPGQNGQPRLYPYVKFEKRTSRDNQNNLHVEMVPVARVNLTGVRTKVIKAYEKIGRPIPAYTKRVLNISNTPAETKKKYEGEASRRASSWNAVKEGFYVKPGPGKQPYFYAIPKGKAGARKTVVMAYAKAGRPIPATVRNIFKIPANINTGNIAKNHNVKMGLNGILRINNKQATRMTKKELLDIARTLNIAQVNAKTKPENLIAAIQAKKGVGPAPNRTFNVKVGSIYYTFLGNGRVEKTTSEGKQTRREWKTMKKEDRDAVAHAFLPANKHAGYTYNTIIQHKNSTRRSPTPRTPSPSPSNSGSIGNFAANLESNMLKNQGNRNKLQVALGNYYKNGNEAAFQNRVKRLPVGARGKPLAPAIQKALKEFAKNTIQKRRHQIIKANLSTKVGAPNWIPNNLKNAYKNELLKVSTTLTQSGKYPLAKGIKNSMRAWLNSKGLLASQPAREVENMLTGQVKMLPASGPPKNLKIKVPKRLSPSHGPVKVKKTPKPKASPTKNLLNKNFALPRTENVENLANAIYKLGLPISSTNKYSWMRLVRAGLNTKYKNTWVKHVITRN
jgi:hypothetical protein